MKLKKADFYRTNLLLAAIAGLYHSILTEEVLQLSLYLVDKLK